MWVAATVGEVAKGDDLERRRAVRPEGLVCEPAECRAQTASRL